MLTLSKSVNHALLAHCSDADTEYSPVRATGRNRVRPRQIFCLLDISTMNSRNKSTLVTLHVRTTSWVRRASLTRDLELLFLQAHHKHSNTTQSLWFKVRSGGSHFQVWNLSWLLQACEQGGEGLSNKSPIQNAIWNQRLQWLLYSWQV